MLSHVPLFATLWTVHTVGNPTVPMDCNPVEPSRLHCPWDFSGKNIGAGCHFLFKVIFLTQGSNPYLLHLLHWQADSLPLSHWGSPTEVPTDTQTSSKNIKNWSNMLL